MCVRRVLSEKRKWRGNSRIVTNHYSPEMEKTNSDGSVEIYRYLPDGVSKRSITLTPEQYEHFSVLREMIKTQRVIEDLSPLGYGKTMIAGSLMLWYGINTAILIAPLNVLPKRDGSAGLGNTWDKLIHMTGVNIEGVTYQSLTSTTGVTNPKHGFLTRRDEHKGNGYIVTTFESTDKLHSYYSLPAFLIIDEGHKAKNPDTKRSIALMSMLETMKHFPQSRCVFMSATMMDKDDQAVQHMKYHGIGLTPLTYSIEISGRNFTGHALSVISDCMKIDRDATLATINNLQIGTYGLDPNFMMSLYRNVVMPKRTSTCKNIDISARAVANGAPNPISHTPNIVNYILNEKETESAMRALYIMKSAIADDGRIDMEELKKGMFCMECYVKVPIIYREAMHILNSDTTSKVVIAVNFIFALETLQKELADLNPIIIRGSIPAAKRAHDVNIFNTSPAHRVIIIITSAGSSGVNMNDSRGDSERHLLISPGWVTIDTEQVMGRVYRVDSMSNAYTKVMMTSIDNGSETTILKRLEERGSVLKSIHVRDQDDPNRRRFLFESPAISINHTIAPYSRYMMKCVELLTSAENRGVTTDNVSEVTIS